jgi:hypothetical protein
MIKPQRTAYTVFLTIVSYLSTVGFLHLFETLIWFFSLRHKLAQESPETLSLTYNLDTIHDAGLTAPIFALFGTPITALALHLLIRKYLNLYAPRG